MFICLPRLSDDSMTLDFFFSNSNTEFWNPYVALIFLICLLSVFGDGKAIILCFLKCSYTFLLLILMRRHSYSHWLEYRIPFLWNLDESKQALTVSCWDTGRFFRNFDMASKSAAAHLFINALALSCNLAT